MNLPNFINFEPFNVLRHKMRILRLGDFDLDRYRREHPSHNGKPARMTKSSGGDGSKSRFPEGSKKSR